MVIQTTVFPSLPRLPVVPDLILVLTVYVGLRHHGIGGAMGAFLFGYFVDTFSGTVLGANAFALTAVYAGVAVVARNLWIEGGLPAVAGAIAVLVAFLLLGVRLWLLQVVHGPEMGSLSENNRIRLVRVPAARGVVYDRHGEILVDNRPAFDVVFVPEDAHDRRRV